MYEDNLLTKQRDAQRFRGLAYEEWERRHLEENFSAYVRQAWKALNPFIPLVDSWYISAIAEHLQAVKLGQISRLIINQPPRTLKACDVDLLVPTPSGIKRLGDIHTGDYVVGINGQPTLVVSETDEWLGDCFEVKFSTGESVICDSGHLWETSVRQNLINSGRGGVRIGSGRPDGSKQGHSRGLKANRRGKGFGHSLNSPTKVRTTREISESVDLISGGKRRSNHKVRVAQPITGSYIKLPIQPYALGAWLGDGTSASAGFTSENNDIPSLCSLSGEPVRALGKPTRYSFSGNSGSFSRRLRELCVLNNKHIPDIYFLSSVQQRTELLQGLMDTDGSCSKRDGQSYFSNTNKRLAEDVKRLIATLGFKPTLTEGVAKIYGRIIGPSYQVNFTAYSDRPVFKLRRKLERQRPPNEKSLQNYRTIVSVKKVSNVLVKCVSVEAPDGMFLVTEGYIPTHNSSTSTIIFPTWVWATEPWWKFIFFSYSFEKLAVPHSLDRRRLISSNWYQKRWGDKFKLRDDENRGWLFSNDKTGRMEVVAQATGVGGNCLIIDDPLSVEEGMSDREREQRNLTVRQALFTRLDKPSTDPIILIMQRLHDKDTTGDLLDSGGWTHLCIRAEVDHEPEKVYFPISKKEIERPVGDILDPIRLPKLTLTRLRDKDLGPRAYEGQYQQRPAPLKGNIIEAGWFQWYKNPVLMRALMDEVVISCDTATTEKELSADVAIQAWGLRGMDSYFLDRITEKANFATTKANIRLMHAKWAADIVLIEDKSTGPAVQGELKGEFPIVMMSPNWGDKINRLQACSPMVEVKTVYLPEDENGAYILNVTTKAPNCKMDDVDAFSQFLNWRRNRGACLGWLKKMAEDSQKQVENPSGEPPTIKQLHDESREMLGLRKPEARKDAPVYENLDSCPECGSTNIFSSSAGTKCLSCGKLYPR